MPYRSGKLIAIAVLLLALAACGPLGPPPRTTVNVIGDKFSKQIELQGIPLHDPTNGVDLFWELRSFVNQQTHTASHQIYVEWTYTGQSSGRYRASDDTARSLPVQNIYKESCAFNKCPRTDTIGIDIDEATLRKRATTGFQVKLSAQDGTSGILDITAQMIGAQLQAEDQALRAGSVSTAVGAADPQVIQGAKEGASLLDRFFNVRYRVTVAAASVCGRRVQPSSGITVLTVSALEPATRAPMLAAYPWLSDDVSVVTVIKGSPAEQAGLRAGDQIVSINSQAPAKGAPGPVSAAKLIQASGSNPWHVTVRRNNAPLEMTVTPARACSIPLDLGKDKAADISADGKLGAGLTEFIRSDDDEAAILAFVLALQISPGSDLKLDKFSLMVAAQAGYKIEAAPDLWQRLSRAQAQLTTVHPVTEERLAAMGREISGLRAKTAQRDE